ncbi:unnamed protein product [Danaus chrysippus]|uniref:(African queen) hypothetical protein n=1 Tax=Danaus chrysippus TaxID=151541 RepID=A0A8J2W3Q8_9NEOP|nr:unnamed protein product [Danaus chrysippus]
MIFFILCVISFTAAAPQNDVSHVEKVRKQPVFYAMDEAPILFEDFIREYNKKYDSKEKEQRFKIFVDNLKRINDLNRKSTNAVHGITKFSDLSEEEFQKFYTGFKPDPSVLNGDFQKNKVRLSFNVTAPAAFDWRDKGVVTRVKIQKHCGSCWAFSTTGNVESINAIKNGNLVELSEQQLVDCDTDSNACKYGYPERAQQYLVSNGAMSEESYPYAAVAGTCKYDSSQVVVKLSSFEHVNIAEDQMVDKLYNTGPLSIVIASKALDTYISGILVDNCAQGQQLDHAVLLVGYGNEGGVDFWLVKNSWGSNWGESGYFRIQRGVNCLMIQNYGVISGIMELGQKQLYSLEEAPTLFEQFIKDYNKEYDENEKEERFKIFVNNLEDINAMNERSSNAVYGINKFSDLSKEEFIKYYTGLKREEIPSNEDHKSTDLPESFNVTAPDQFDWRKKGVVTSVKNQRHYGSCWAFSASANVESINAIKTGKLIDVSEQQLVDCDIGYDLGCLGGLAWVAMSYFRQYGAMSLKSYPYVAKEGSCHYDSRKVVIRLKDYKHVTQLTEDQIKEHLYNIGPLSIGIAAAPISSYTGGIVIEDCHSSFQVNHAVLLVGYGKENGVEYWIVKNSWGQNWGEKGYFRMQRGVNCLLITEDGYTTAVI